MVNERPAKFSGISRFGGFLGLNRSSAAASSSVGGSPSSVRSSRPPPSSSPAGAGPNGVTSGSMMVGNGAPSSSKVSRASQLGIGLGKGGKGKGGAGLGLGKSFLKRHKKIPRDTIRGISKPDIRRLARRGGVKRISATIYDDVREALKARLERILGQVIPVLELGNRKTVTVQDIIFALNRLGATIYGYDPTFNGVR